MSERHLLPADTRPGPVHLQVAELGRSRAWYDRVLGLADLGSGDPGAGSDAPGARLGAPDGRPLLGLLEHPGASPVPRGGRLGLFHYAILLPDRGALGRFVSHLARIGEPAGASDHRVSEAIYLHDPDGLGIEVYADRPREAWERAPTGELAMATDPLDLDDLVRAGGGTPWEGIPPGTVMGHLHLHVGDLARAEAFYADAVGLDVMVRSYPGALFLAAGGYHHHLGVNTWARGAAPAGPTDARLLAWELEVPSEAGLAAALDRLEAAGHEIDRTDGGGVVSDPWGTRLRLRIP